MRITDYLNKKPLNSAGECFLYTEEVVGSTPTGATWRIICKGNLKNGSTVNIVDL